MSKLAQPLTADERHHANKAIEFASTLMQHARWGIAGFLMIALFAPLQITLRMMGWILVNPLPVLAVIGVVAFFASSPVANAAEGIRYRSRRTLVIAIVVIGLSVGISVLGTLVAILVDIRFIRRHDIDGALTQGLIAFLMFAVLLATTWVLRQFVAALRAVDRLKAKAPQGFAVIMESDAKPSNEPTPYKLPPRPKR